jgi:hypothetical protein
MTVSEWHESVGWDHVLDVHVQGAAYRRDVSLGVGVRGDELDGGFMRSAFVEVTCPRGAAEPA